MIYLTQLIYLTDGQENIFHQFEELAIPIILKYNGRLTLRIRPESKTVIENNIEVPYEIHLVEFDTQEDFERFKMDKERVKFLHLKEQAIRSTILIKGERIN